MLFVVRVLASYASGDGCYCFGVTFFQISCPYCPRHPTFPNQQALKQHLEFCLKIRRLQCAFCTVCYPNEETLSGHEQSVHEGMPAKCKKCCGQFAYDDLKTHLAQCQVEAYTCRFCARQSNNVLVAKAHELVHFDLDPLACAVCQLSFDGMHELECHVTIVHDGSSICLCAICATEQDSLKALSVHGKQGHRSIKDKLFRYSDEIGVGRKVEGTVTKLTVHITFKHDSLHLLRFYPPTMVPYCILWDMFTGCAVNIPGGPELGS